MCTNQREIVNKYTGHKLYVKCGHCEACLQEKAAHRVSRLKAQDSDALDCVMVSLTYRRHDSPYVYHDEAYWFSQGLLGYSDLQTKSFHSLPLEVYRDNNYRKVRVSSDYDIGYKNLGKKVLCEIDPLYTKENKRAKVCFKGVKDLAHVRNKIGICFYPDVQDFVERLRINLIRNYDFTGIFKTFCCSEYGSVSLRPHFHLLLWIPKGSFQTFRNAIIESWPYGDISKFDRAVEKAYRASTYVASYVNCASDFPDFLKTFARPKHSYSKDFGFNLNVYGLLSVLSKFERGSLSFFKCIDKQGLPSVVECPLPKYVISRYFPQFKGYNRVAPAAICDLMQRFKRFDYSQKTDMIGPQVLGINRIVFPVYYTPDEIYKISVKLNNAYARFLSLADSNWKISFNDYCLLHKRIWSCYNSTLLRLHLTNTDIPFYEKYDNLEEVRCRTFDFELNDYTYDNLPVGFTRDNFSVTNPNMFKSVMSNTAMWRDSFHEHIKHRRVANVVYSSINEEF